MKQAIAITAALLIVLCCGISMAADNVKSGPQVGEQVPGPFHPLNVFNAVDASQNGKKACLFCQHGQAPVAMIFAREITAPVTTLIQKLDAEVVKNKAVKMGAFVVVLTDEEKTAETKLKNIVESKNIKNVSLSIDNPTGPAKYNVAKDAEVTVVLYNEHKVVSNFAFKTGEFTTQSVEKIISDLPKLVNN